jgi:hypothetical protein
VTPYLNGQFNKKEMKYGKMHESWKKASYIWEKDICDGEGQVLLRDIRVMERGQSLRKRDD